MTLISLLMTWGVLQFRGSKPLSQRDRWFYRWVKALQKNKRLSSISGGVQLLALVAPLLLLALLSMALIVWVSPLMVLLVNIPVLLYSLGRGDFEAQVGAYMQAWRRDDSAACVHILMKLDDQLPAEELLGDASSWTQLHQQALRTFAYAGFERIFAVLFWFLLLGATGALLYRLSSLYLQAVSADEDRADERHLAAKWLWLLEWPAVRLLGLSWALVGNFVGCFSLWREHLFCVRQSSAQMLLFSVQGALGLAAEEQQEQSEDSTVVCTQVGCSAHQVEALQSLLSRSLLLWICVVAAVTLFF